MNILVGIVIGTDPGKYNGRLGYRTNYTPTLFGIYFLKGTEGHNFYTELGWN